MTEGLFILTTIFVAYVVHAIMGEEKANAKSQVPAAKPEAPAAVVEQPKPQVAVVTEKTAPTAPVEAKKIVEPKVVATAVKEPPKPTAAKVVTATKEAAPKIAAKPAAAKATTVTKEAAPKVAAKPTATKTTTAAKSTPAKKAATPAVKSAGLKDPKSGEVVTSYSNYRFIKRWIKDALVTEGLLEKVYAANELNTATDSAIKEAIAKLEAMDKYKA
jgi:outer membrane biosynthesis protein TonB